MPRQDKQKRPNTSKMAMVVPKVHAASRVDFHHVLGKATNSPCKFVDSGDLAKQDDLILLLVGGLEDKFYFSQ